MPNFDIQIAKNGDADNTNVPFYIEVIQNSIVILGAFSTQVNPTSTTPLLVGSTPNFDQSLSTTINYYNLGTKTNNINVSGVNYDGFGVFSSGNTPCLSGEKKSITFGPQAGNYGLLLKVTCSEIVQTSSGVTYAIVDSPTGASAGTIGSFKTANTAWVSTLTPNVATNPNYIAPASSTLPIPTITANTNNPNTSIITLFPSGTGGSLSTKTVQLWINNVLFTTITTQGTSYIWSDLLSGSYKIRYFTNSSTQPYSGFSNVLILESVPSTVPTISSFESSLSSNLIARVYINGASNATLKIYKAGTQVGTETIGSTGSLVISITTAGSYTFTITEPSKSESNPTTSITIAPYGGVVSNCVASGTFIISNATYTAGILTFQHNATESFGNVRYEVSSGSNLITSGNTGTPSGGGNPSFAVATLPTGTYNLKIIGISCTGTATTTFVVASTSTNTCDSPTGTITPNQGTFLVGENLSIATSGVTNATEYVWYKNGMVLTGQTATTLSVSSLQLTANGDKYKLLIKNVCGGDKVTATFFTNEITLSVNALGTTRTCYVPVRFNDIAECNSEILQIGYSTSQTPPTVWFDTDLTKILVSNGGVTSEVISGGTTYKARAFALTAGTYYFYARQKTATANSAYLGSVTITI